MKIGTSVISPRGHKGPETAPQEGDMKNMENIVRNTEKVFYDGEPQNIKITRDGKKLEIAPEDFGWIWTVEYSSAKDAAAVERKLRKLDNATLTALHNEANTTIRFKIIDDFRFRQASTDLIDRYLRN